MPLQQVPNQKSLIDFNTYIPDYIGKPIDSIANMSKTLYDNNQRILDRSNAIDIAISNLNVDPVDSAILDEQKQNFKTGIGQIGEDGNYGLAEAKLNSIYKDFVTNKALSSSVARKQDYDAWRQKVRDDYQKKLISYDAMRDALTKPFTPTQPDEFGFYNDQYEGKRDYVNPFDYDEYFSELTRNWKADGTNKAPRLVKDEASKTYYWESDGKKITEDEVRNALKTSITNKPEAMAFAKEQAELNPNFREAGLTVDDVVDNWMQAHIDRTVYDEGKNYAGFNYYGGKDKDENTQLLDDFYGISTLLETPSFDNMMDAITPRATSTNSGGYESTREPNLLNYFRSAKDSPDDNTKDYGYRLNKLDDSELTMLNGYARGIGGLDNFKYAGGNVKNLNDKDKAIVFDNISKFVEKQENLEAVTNVSFARIYNDDKLVNTQNNKFFGNAEGMIKNPKGDVVTRGTFNTLEKLINVDTGEEVDAQEYIDSLPENSYGNVIGETNYTNPITFRTDDYQFAKSKIVQFNGKDRMYAAMPLGNAQYINSEDVQKAKILSSYYKEGQPTPIFGYDGEPHEIKYVDRLVDDDNQTYYISRDEEGQYIKSPNEDEATKAFVIDGEFVADNIEDVYRYINGEFQQQ